MDTSRGGAAAPDPTPPPPNPPHEGTGPSPSVREPAPEPPRTAPAAPREEAEPAVAARGPAAAPAPPREDAAGLRSAPPARPSAPVFRPPPQGQPARQGPPAPPPAQQHPLAGPHPPLQPPQGPPTLQGPLPAAPPAQQHPATEMVTAARPTASLPVGAPPGAAAEGWAPPPVFTPQPPPRRGGAGLWLTAGGAALVAAVSLVVCVALTVSTLGGGIAQASGKPHREVLYEDSWFHTARGIPVDVVSHPFYDLPAPRTVECALPDFDPSSVSEWEAFTDAVGPCLNEMWLPSLEEMGLRPEEPHYVVTDEIPPDLRGESEEEGVTLAYYMEYDLSITILVPNVRKLLPYPNMDDKRIWFALVAHEYGHHVQGETGLLDRAYTLERKAGSEAEELQVGRQIELQAECLAGTGVARLSVHDGGDVAFVNRTFNEGTGDSDTHGSADNRVHWFDSGAAAETMEACNTFAADTGLVR